MILQSRMICLIVFTLLCCVYHIDSFIQPMPTISTTNTAIPENKVLNKPIKPMLSMTFRNGEPLEYHKKRFGLFYRAKRKHSR